MPMLILAALAAAATTAPQPGAVKTFKDWTVACDNIQSCSAVMLMPEDEAASDDYTLVSLARTGLANAPITIDADTGSARGEVVLMVDGAAVQPLGTAKGSGVSGALTLATLAKMAQGSRIEIRVAGKAAGSGSLAGFSAAMRYWDAAQRRDGGTDAIVAKGKAVRSIVPPPAPRVTAARIPLAKVPVPGKATIAMLAKKFGCEDEQDGPGSAEAYALGGGRTLILVPCGAGAYNFSSKPVIATGKSYVLAPFDLAPDWGGGDIELVNAGFDAKTATLSSFAKGRGVGDCGTSQTWVWDGTRFRLTEMTRMDECRGSVDWMRTWTATVVR